MDGEDAGVDPAELDVHLRMCRGCRTWEHQAYELTRRLRVHAAEPARLDAAALVDAVVPVNAAASVGSAARGREPAPPRVWVRVLLVVVAALQLGVALPALWSGAYAGVPTHVAQEVGAWQLAVVVGLLAVAGRPRLAEGLSWAIGAAAGGLVVTGVLGVRAGQTTVAEEARHLLVVVGWLLTLVLAYPALTCGVRRRVSAATLWPVRRLGSRSALRWPLAAARVSGRSVGGAVLVGMAVLALVGLVRPAAGSGGTSGIVPVAAVRREAPAAPCSRGLSLTPRLAGSRNSGLTPAGPQPTQASPSVDATRGVR